MKKYLFAIVILVIFASCKNEFCEQFDPGYGHDTTFSIIANLNALDTESEVKTKAVANAVVRLYWTEGDKLSAINLTTGKALGGDLVALESGKSTHFSGTLTGEIRNGDKIAFLYPSQGYTEEQPFNEAVIDFSQQHGTSEVPLAVYGVKTLSTSATQDLSIDFNYLMSYYQISLAELPPSASLRSVSIDGMGAMTTLTINDTHDGLLSSSSRGILTVSSTLTNNNGAKIIYLSGFASDGGERRTIDVDAGAYSYSTDWTSASLATGKYYTSVISGFEKSVKYTDISLEKAGTLKTAINDAGYSVGSIQSLRVSGPLNGDDILTIRNMLGRGKGHNDTSSGSLEYLDMSNASIVTGGGYYYLSSYDDGYTSRYTSNDVIGTHMFVMCQQLKRIILPSNLKGISFQAFEGCCSLESLTIPASVENISYDFYSDNQALSDNISVDSSNPYLRIENGCIYKGTTLIWSFPYNTNVTVADGTTEINSQAFVFGREYYDEMDLYQNSYLNSVTLPESLISIGNNAFSGCISLKSIQIPNSVQSIGNSSFADCKSLQDIHLSESLSSLSQRVFYGCKSLNILQLPSSIQTIGSNAFDGCSSLFDVYCYSSSVPTITNSGNRLPSGATVHVLENLKNSYLSNSNWNYASNGNIMGTIVKYDDGVNDYGYGIPVLSKVGSKYEMLIWAPVNCGYSDNYPYGKLYQWGRKDGQGYGNANSADEAGMQVNVVSVNDAISSGTTMNSPSANTFYSSNDTPYDWYSKTTAACFVIDWNKIPESSSIGNPCPDGWRVPTYNEMQSLAMSISQFSERDGRSGFYLKGYKSSIPDDLSVFLPQSGYRSYYSGDVSGRVSYAYSYNYYWTSTPSSYKSYAVDVKSGNGSSTNRAYGYPVRCVRGNTDSIVETPDIIVSVRDMTSNSAFVDITVVSDGGSSITDMGIRYGVDQYYMSMQSLIPGQTTYTYKLDKLIDGETYYLKAYANNEAGMKETSIVNFKTLASSATPTYTAIDLGLPSGLKWASSNVGALVPEGAGRYFGWGMTDGYDKSENSYDWGPYFVHLGGTGTSYSDCGKDADPLKDIVKNAGVQGMRLPSSNDAATVNMGGTWRMPTENDYTELFENCTYSEVVQNGVRGILLVSKTNSKSLFIPFAGHCAYASWYSYASSLELWTASPGSSTSYSGARSVRYYGGSYFNTQSRFYGLPVRGVRP